MKPFHWLFAKVFGYFWLPCHLCGGNFGGHQAGIYGCDGQIVCPKAKCQTIAQERHQKEMSESLGILISKSGLLDGLTASQKQQLGATLGGGQ